MNGGVGRSGRGRLIRRGWGAVVGMGSRGGGERGRVAGAMDAREHCERAGKVEGGVGEAAEVAEVDMLEEHGGAGGVYCWGRGAAGFMEMASCVP